ncbi:MAG: peptidase M29, partial [Rhodobacterales bacterium 17-64-5]
MMQERIEGKWLDAFRRVLALNGIGRGTKVAILSESQSRPVLVQLSDLACHDLGAEYCLISMPSPKQTAPVPVKSTGTSWAVQQNRAVIEALKRVEVVVDCTVEGMIHAPEWPEIEAAGTRLLVICNEHPEILERTEPTAALGPKVALGTRMLREASEMRVTSDAGTDLVINLRGAPCGGTAGFGTKPGDVAHWPGGLCLAFPGKNAVNGRIVMDVGDMNLTFKTYLTSRIDCTIENDFVTAIKGDGIDALHFREYLAAWDDPNAYGLSHVGWGMNPHAHWISAAM